MPRTIGVMMIGMALFKLGFFSGKARPWVYRLFAGIGVVALALIAWQAGLNAEAGFAFEHMQRRGGFANGVLSIFVSLGYASAADHAGERGLVRWVTDALAAVGRMAFTQLHRAVADHDNFVLGRARFWPVRRGGPANPNAYCRRDLGGPADLVAVVAGALRDGAVGMGVAAAVPTGGRSSSKKEGVTS